VGSSLADMSSGLLASVSRGGSKAGTRAQQNSAEPAAPSDQPTAAVPATLGGDSSSAQRDVASSASAPTAPQEVTTAGEPAKSWSATLSGLGSSLWPARPCTKGAPVIDASDKPEAPNDGLPTSFSASQQLTPRRSQDGGQA
jgi:hypothetical protein